MSKGILKYFFAVFALLLTGCVKDDPGETFLNLYAEDYTPDKSAAKAAVDASGTTTYWVDGDRVWVNNKFFKVTITKSDGSDAVATMENNASIKGEYPLYAIYPASAKKGGSRDTYTINVPKLYNYRESGPSSGHKQILDGLPMVAYSGDADPEALSFKHLTAAITVQVKNMKKSISGVDSVLVLDKIELINNTYKLGGDVLVTISDDEPVIMQDAESPIPYNQKRPDTVTVNFYDVKPQIAEGGYKNIQIPILPVGSDLSTFTINVYCHCDGRKFSYERTTNAGVGRDNSMLRASIGYAVTQFTKKDQAFDLFEEKVEEVVVNDSVVKKRFYEISNIEDMLMLSEAMDNQWKTSDESEEYIHANYMVTQDIDMKGTKIKPIHYYNKGAKTEADRRYFYGGGYTIKNFTASSVGDKNEPNACGLFGRTAGERITICDLNIEDASYEFAHIGVSGLIPNDQNPCSAVGGIYACIDHPGIEIVNCTVRNVRMGAVNGAESGSNQTDFYASGIVGVAQRSCKIINCVVENVYIDNSAEWQAGNTNKVVDQFGAAIGRIDVGKAMYGDYVASNRVQDVPCMVIKNFVYDQIGPSNEYPTLTFAKNLKNIRYGGLVANVTRGGILIVENVTLKHNVQLNSASIVYASGFIGCQKADKKWALCVKGQNICTGVIDNQCCKDYNANTLSGKEINPYISCTGKMKYLVKVEEGSPVDLLYGCGASDEEFEFFDLAFAPGSLKAQYQYPKQTFFGNGNK